MDRRHFVLTSLAGLRRTALGVLVLGVAGCAPSLMAVTDPTLDGWAVLSQSPAGTRVLVGSSNVKLCEEVRRGHVNVSEPFPVRCRHVRLDLNPLSPNFYAAVGAQPSDGVLLFVGGSTQDECDRLRGGSRWSGVPCRPVMLIER